MSVLSESWSTTVVLNKIVYKTKIIENFDIILLTTYIIIICTVRL